MRFISAGFFLLALTSLVGCDEARAGGKKIHLVMATVAMPAQSRERERYQAAADRFCKRHPEVEVELLEITGNYYHKVLVMIAGRNAPDLMWMGGGFAEFAQRDALLDVTARIESSHIDTSRFLPQSLGWYRFNGKQYGIPFGIDTQFIIYNKKLFDDAKLPYPTDEWKFDDFFRDAKALTKDLDGDGRTDRYGFAGELDPAAFGAQYISTDGKRALCNSPEMIEYFQTNQRLVNDEKVAIQGKSGGDNALDDVVSLFRQGKVAMALMFTWDLPLLKEKLADMDWDIVANPRVHDQPGHWASSRAVVISAETRHPDEAWDLAQEYFGEEFQRAMADTIVPSDLHVAEQVAAAHTGKPQNIRALIDAVHSAHVFPRVPSVTELMQYWNDARDAVRDGRLTPQQAMTRAESDIRHAIKKRSSGAAR